MPSTGWTTRIVPYGADETVYLVVDRFDSSAAFTAKPKLSGQTSKRSLPISCQGNSTIQYASWHSTRWSIGRRTSRNKSLTKFKPAAILKVLRSPNM
jgi:hypothetical protein